MSPRVKRLELFLDMLIRIPRRPPSIRYAFKSRQPYTTVFSPKKYRQIDHKAFEDMKTVLLYILRPGTSGEYGFGNRDDGYVSVKQLVSFSVHYAYFLTVGIQLNHPEFKSLDIIKLQYIVNTDKKHRFDLEFDPTKGADSYWLRAKQWNVRYCLYVRAEAIFTHHFNRKFIG